MTGFQSLAGQSFRSMAFPEAQKADGPPLFDTVFEAADCAMIILDVGFDSTPVVADANHLTEDWLGTSREAISGFPFFDLFDRVVDSAAVMMLRQAFALRNDAQGELHLTIEEGHVVPVHVRLRPVSKNTARHPNGVRERYVAIMHRTDAAYQQQIEETTEARIEAENTRDRFLARMSHDLRTPLNGILGFADAMEQEILGPLGQDQYREYIQNILSAGRDLLGKVDDLLSHSAGLSGDESLNKEPVDAVLLASSCAARARPSATVSKLALICEAAPELPNIEVDPEAARRAIDSVLDNAIRNAPPMSRILLQVRAGANGGIDFEIFDGGAPIPPAQVAAEIERTNHNDSVYATTFERSISGLGIAWTVLQMHEGVMTFEEHQTRRTRRRATSLIRLSFT